MWRLVFVGLGLVSLVVSTCSREVLLFRQRDELDECNERAAAAEDNFRELGKTNDLLSKHLLRATCGDFCSQLRLPPRNVWLTGNDQLECQCGHD